MVRRWKAWTKRWGQVLLARFDKWFTSGAGVWQTLAVCMAIVFVEIVWPSLDPHYFYLLAILTVYSAITQPALAQAGAVTSEEIRKIALDLKAIIESQAIELREEGEVLDDVRDLLKIGQSNKAILEDVQDVQKDAQES